VTLRWDVLGIGAVSVDDLVYVGHHPLPDSKMEIHRIERQGGGLVGTALVAAARLGARAAYWGVLDDEDELGRFTIHELERERVDCTLVVRRRGARPFYSIVIIDRSTGQRSILFTGDGVCEVPPEAMAAEHVAACRVLLVDHTIGEAGLAAVSTARRYGIPVVADIEPNSNPRLPELLERVDHLIVGTEFGRQFTGEAEPEAMVRALAGRRACCAVTAGRDGAWYALAGGPVRHLSAFAVRAVDTTGCGDVFHGAYAASIARAEAPERALLVATAAAGLKAMQRGGRAGIPHREAVEHFLAAQL
jgi:sulfofructose kinase